MCNVKNQGYYQIKMSGMHYAKQHLNKQQNINLDLVKGRVTTFIISMTQHVHVVLAINLLCVD